MVRTTMLLYGIIQDIQAGQGVAVLDPTRRLIWNHSQAYSRRKNEDVIYFNPDDITHPIGG